jgi:replication-associated recombination protein RarA
MSLLLWGRRHRQDHHRGHPEPADRPAVRRGLRVSAGVKEVRAAIDAARAELVASGHETVLFVDEIHRFSKAQQDALLPGVGEPLGHAWSARPRRTPFFSVISPLLSRSLLLAWSR